MSFPETEHERLPRFAPRKLAGTLRPIEIAHAINRRKVEQATFKDVGMPDMSTLRIGFEPIDEATVLLSRPPMPTDHEAHPKTIAWNEEEEVEVTENSLFDNLDVTVISAPNKSHIFCQLIATVRNGAVRSRRSQLTQRLILDSVCKGSLTYKGEPLTVTKHFPAGDGIGFNFAFEDGMIVAVELIKSYSEDEMMSSTVLDVRVSSKPRETNGTDNFAERIKTTLERFGEVIPSIVQIFTEAYADTPTEPTVLTLPIDKLRNRQTGKYAHETVEAPDNLSDKADMALFEQIARNPGTLDFGIIGGLENPIEEMRRLIVISKNPEAFTNRGLNHPNCVLLHGPPGTGKSLLAEVAAKELDGYYLKVDCSDILIKWVGESEARIRTIFRLIAKLARDKPVAVFFDEFDTLGSKKRENSPEWMRSIVNTMLTAINELPKNCIAIAAVNDVDALEPAIKREGRFSRIAVNPPNASAREAIIRNWIEHYDLQPAGQAFGDVDIPEIVSNTDGFCGSDIQALLSRTLIDATITSLVDAQPARPQTHEDIMRALRTMKQLSGDAANPRVGQYL